MAFLNPTAGQKGFSESQAPSYKKIEMKPKADYKKKKGFPPARKAKEQRTSFPATPPDYPSGVLL